MTSLLTAETEKSVLSSKIDVVCLRLFCELAKMERLVFDNEKNENNAHFKFNTAFTFHTEF